MSPFPLTPLPGQTRSLPRALTLLGSAAALVVLSAVGAGSAVVWGSGDEGVLALSFLSFFGALVLVLWGWPVLERWRTDRQRGREMALAAAGRGLALRPPLTGREVDVLRGAPVPGFRGLPLFDLSRHCPVATSDWVLRGDLDGEPVLVFDVGYQWWVDSWASQDRTDPTDAIEFATRRVDDLFATRYRHRHSVQTVAVLPASGLGHRFHRGPTPSDRDAILPDWPALVGLDRRHLVPADRPRPHVAIHCSHEVKLPPALHRPQEPFRAFFGPPQSTFEGALDRAGDWVIESCGRSLLLYRTGRVVSPEEVAPFLDEVQAIAARLILAAGEHSRVEKDAAQPLVATPATNEDAPPRDEQATAGLRRFALFVPGTEASLGVALFPLLMGSLGTAFVVVVALETGIDLLMHLGWLLLFVCGIGSALLLFPRAVAMHRGRALGEAAKAFGLRRRGRLTRDEVAGLSSLPFFRFAGPTLSLSRYALEGRLQGRDVRVFELSFLTSHRNPQGLENLFGTVHLAAAVQMPEVRGHFHCGAIPNVWDEIQPGWSEAQGLTSVETIDTSRGATRVVIRKSDGVAPMPPAVRRELAVRGTGAVEGSPGLLLIYARDGLLTPEDLPAFVEMVRRVVRAFGGPPDEPDPPAR